MPVLDDILSKVQEVETALTQIEIALFTGRYKFSKKHKEIFYVQSISIIYSIWEGFIQNIFQLYISEINTKNIDFDKLIPQLKIFHMQKSFKQFAEYPSKDNQKITFFTKLKVFYSNPYQSIYPRIDSQNNLGLDVLNKILETFGMEKLPKNWKTYRHPQMSLEETLSTFLRYRNSVAHGGDISTEEKVTKSVYEKYKNLIIDLAYEIYSKIEDSLINETYIES